MIISSFNAGLNGIHKATAVINQAYEQLLHKALVGNDSNTLAAEFVALKQNVILFQASGKVIQASSNNLGSLLDIFG